MERSADADRYHAIPDRQFDLIEAFEDHEARVVDKSIDATEAGDGELNDSLARTGVFEILVASSGDASCGIDLRSDRIGDGWVEAAAILGDTRIVDNDRSATGGDQAS